VFNVDIFSESAKNKYCVLPLNGSKKRTLENLFLGPRPKSPKTLSSAKITGRD